MDKSIAEAKNLALASMTEWRGCLERLGDEAAVAGLDRERADFEAGRRKPVSRKPDPRMIDENLFWEIIGVRSSAEPAQHIEEIVDRLAAFSATQIKTFDKLLWEVMQRLNHHDVWAVAYLLQDGCSDDAFEAFRAWTILQGREACRLVLEDPETFLERTDTRGTMDGALLLEIPAMAYDRRAGKIYKAPKRPPALVQGAPWEEDLIERTYPRLAARVNAMKATDQGVA